MKLFGNHINKKENDMVNDINTAPVLEKVEKPAPETRDISAEVYTCKNCGHEMPLSDIRKLLYVCPKCSNHDKVSAKRRINALADPGTFRKLKVSIPFKNPLSYPGYAEKIAGLQTKTGLEEGVISGVCEIEGFKTVVVVMASEFLMGSMGIAVGEMVTEAFEAAEKMDLPIVIFTASGGARMQEGILSLMQMAKTSAAAKRFSENGGLYISVLTHPTTGGVSASFATLADITLAEPGALIGFAGPRVIEQTIGQKLPEGFQRAEYLEEHGFVDSIVPRSEMRDTLAQILKLHEKRRKSWLR